jgi:hypothetical protein
VGLGGLRRPSDTGSRHNFQIEADNVVPALGELRCQLAAQAATCLYDQYTHVIVPLTDLILTPER